MSRKRNAKMSNSETCIRDYLAEKAEQRIGIDEDSIVKRNAYIFDLLEEIKSAHPGIDPVRLERATAHDALNDVTQRLETMSCYIDSILWLLDDYIEDLGTDVPPMVEHIQWDMSHLADDCKRLSADAYSASRLAQGMIRHPRVTLD